MRSGNGFFIGNEVLELFPVEFPRELDLSLLVCFMSDSVKVCVLFLSVELKDIWTADFFVYMNNLNFEYLSSCENEDGNETLYTLDCEIYRLWVNRFLLYFVDDKKFYGEIIYVDEMDKVTHIEVSLCYESLDPVHMVDELLVSRKAYLDIISIRVTEEFINECLRIMMIQCANVDIVSSLNERVKFNEKVYNENIENIFHFYSVLNRNHLQEKVKKSLGAQYKDPLLNCFRVLETQKQSLQLSLSQLLSSRLKANKIAWGRSKSPLKGERQRTIIYEKRVVRKAKSSRVCQECTLF